MDTTISELIQELSTFPEREQKLRNIKRYSLYDVMFYRSSLYSHGKRITWLLKRVEPLLRKTFGMPFDMKKAYALALVHDDAEIITGDHQAATKQKMSKAELARLEDEEREAIKILAGRFPKKVGGYVYQDLLEEVVDLPSPEAQVSKFLDRFDAQGEAWHEMFGGNVRITKRVINAYGVNALPYEFYHQQLPHMLLEYPFMKRLAGTHLFFQTPELRDWGSVAASSKPHTKTSLYGDTDHFQYNEWRQTVLDSGDSEEIENLYTQREFL